MMIFIFRSLASLESLMLARVSSWSLITGGMLWTPFGVGLRCLSMYYDMKRLEIYVWGV